MRALDLPRTADALRTAIDCPRCGTVTHRGRDGDWCPRCWRLVVSAARKRVWQSSAVRWRQTSTRSDA